MARPPQSLTLVGAGKMGGALLRGWLDVGVASGGITIVDPHPDDALRALCATRGLALNPVEPSPTAILILAIKPQLLDIAAPALARLVDAGALVLSILAGKTVADLAARLPTQAIVRAMPNTPAAVGRGATGAFASAGVSAAQRETADTLLSAVGSVEWLDDEALIDAVTAVSGSGPAYVFHMVESLGRAGVAAGLPADVALRLARATVEGAGALLAGDAATSAAKLRENVTSPGGTTAAALDVLMAPDGLGALMTRAVAAAKRRAGELSG